MSRTTQQKNNIQLMYCDSMTNITQPSFENTCSIGKLLNLFCVNCNEFLSFSTCSPDIERRIYKARKMLANTLYFISPLTKKPKSIAIFIVLLKKIKSLDQKVFYMFEIGKLCLQPLAEATYQHHLAVINSFRKNATKSFTSDHKCSK